MDQTAIQKGAPLPAAGGTNIQAGPPPGAAEAPEAKPQAQPKHPLRMFLEYLADLRITVVLFGLALVLVFWGTLAQVDWGVWTVVNKYFRSLLVWVPLKVVLFNAVDWKAEIPYPGGQLIGAVMMVNLLAAHAIRFKLAWNRAGIILIHAGIIIMMLGEVVTTYWAEEGIMQIGIGQTVSHVTHPGASELAIVHTKNPKLDKVVAIPSSHLKTGAVIDNEKVPFKIDVIEFMVNSTLIDWKPGTANRASRGFGKAHVAKDEKEVAGVANDQRHDAPSICVKLTSRDGKQNLGSWLYSVHFEQPQWLTLDGKDYQVSLRFKQTSRPFSIHLKDFHHKVFPGEPNKPRDFRSFIHLSDPEEGVERDDEIFMNSPMRYRGETFYQSSWTTDPRTGKANGTILQVVRNPGWLMPYFSCGIVGIGMLMHFGLTLTRFLERRMTHARPGAAKA